jgi:hypothetical protein
VSEEGLRTAREQLCKVPQSFLRDHLHQIIEHASRFRELKVQADGLSDPVADDAADLLLDREVQEADWLLAEAEAFDHEFHIIDPSMLGRRSSTERG